MAAATFILILSCRRALGLPTCLCGLAINEFATYLQQLNSQPPLTNLIMKNPLFIILLFLLFACRKEEQIYPTKQYEQFGFYGLTNFSAYRLFTKTGEINNSGLVAQYADSHSQFFYNTSSSFTGNQYKNFSFVNDDSIINTGIAPAGELKRTMMSEYDVFTSKYTIPINDTNTINLHLGKYKLHYSTTTPLGYTYFELNDPAVILKKAGDKLYLPIVRYIITSTRDNSFSFAAERFNNVLDVTGVTKLGAHDTLLVQTFDVELRRK